MSSVGQKQKGYSSIYSGVPWFDDKGNTVSANGPALSKTAADITFLAKGIPIPVTVKGKQSYLPLLIGIVNTLSQP